MIECDTGIGEKKHQVRGRKSGMDLRLTGYCSSFYIWESLWGPQKQEEKDKFKREISRRNESKKIQKSKKSKSQKKKNSEEIWIIEK